jgi:DNA-binding transcriptional ArsR family regulator
LDEVDWSSLHKILSDTTRRSILELLSEKQALSYTEIMTLLGITNTGRLNYHLKVLGNLVSKDEEGKYRLTERGQIAVNLLRTFPERAPAEKKPSALKASVAIVLILVGILIIASFSFGLLGLSASISVSSNTQVSISSQLIPQNTTVSLTPFAVSDSPLSISWSASSPVYIYVLNQSQDDALLLQHPTAGQALLNFTGAPTSWVDRLNNQTGNSTLPLPQGEYYFASSNTQATLNTFSFGEGSQPHQVGTLSASPLLYLYFFVFIAIGALLIVLAFSILTRRIWR